MSVPELLQAVESAWHRRSSFMARCAQEQTSCYRLFHGSAEGGAGVTIDRYAETVLVQTFHQSLTDAELEGLELFYKGELPLCTLIYNDRSATNSRYQNTLSPSLETFAKTRQVGLELGMKVACQARHQGQDPLLFLDLRVVRRYLQASSAGKSVLNTFAYTCGAGVAAALGGAKQVINVDFAESSLAVGKENAALNDLSTDVIKFVQDDYFAVVRQFAGLNVGGRRGQNRGKIRKRPVQQFDLVLLDPPRWAKSPFGVVDLVNDYASVFKPALLSTAEGGVLICTNNVAKVASGQWLEQLQRAAQKAGRPAKQLQLLTPEEDFPSFDDQPPLKVAVLEV
ncbi:SAM-dependent methyltransferase [Oleiphilus messinensis]|uniref:SAM-dependent methyltransferase n=1 Tax=Oleiphilus messinensis TaxID=141451 RepID=A0A1Y0IEE5_9GAMM|nr:class I SAM-dependent methyltransferase [Oleiphilus messinensis]ARU58549.1 SAM-dependent methyltransferase [Oleiphilus messinensis]